jgi:hypothetical protein
MKMNVMKMKNVAWKLLLLLERETKNMKKIMMNTNWEWLLVTMVHLTIHILGLNKTLNYPPL